MAARLGIKISPHTLGDLFKAGTLVIPAGGPTIRLMEGGVPLNHHLVHSGVIRDTGEFFMIFAAPGADASDPVDWRAPVYEKEEGGRR